MLLLTGQIRRTGESPGAGERAQRGNSYYNSCLQCYRCIEVHVAISVAVTPAVMQSLMQIKHIKPCLNGICDFVFKSAEILTWHIAPPVKKCAFTITLVL